MGFFKPSSLLIIATALAAGPALATPRNAAEATSNSSTINDINVPRSIPNAPGPVPKGYVPVLTVYGQSGQEPDSGVVGAQLSIPLNF